MGARRASRPTTVTFLLWGVFIIGVLNGWRAVSWWQDRRLLSELNLLHTATWNMLIAIFWMLIFFRLALALWRRRSCTRWALPVSVALYGLVRLVILLFVLRTLPAEQAWMLPSLAFGMMVMLTAWICWRPANRRYWKPDVNHAVRTVPQTEANTTQRN